MLLGLNGFFKLNGDKILSIFYVILNEWFKGIEIIYIDIFKNGKLY